MKPNNNNFKIPRAIDYSISDPVHTYSKLESIESISDRVYNTIKYVTSIIVSTVRNINYDAVASVNSISNNIYNIILSNFLIFRSTLSLYSGILIPLLYALEVSNEEGARDEN